MIGWKVIVVEKAIWSTWRTEKTCKRHLTVKGPFLCSKKQPSFSGNTQVAVLCRIKTVAAKIPRFSLRDHAGMNRTAAKDYRRITQGFLTQRQQLRAYLHTRTGKETKITSLAEVWHETVLQMEGYLIIFEVFFHPMVEKRRQLAHQVYNRHPLVNEENVTHSSLKEKLGLTNFSAWQIKIKW